jgi:hypothetical protein
MALTLYPTFTPSGWLNFATALVQLQGVTQTGIPQFGSVAAPTGAKLPAGTSPASVLISNIGPDPAVVAIAAATASTTGTATAGSTALAVTSGTSIAVGQVVVGVGIAPGTVVASVSGTAVTLSIPTIAALSTTAVAFLNAIGYQSGIVVQPGNPPLGLAYVSSGYIQALCYNQSGKAVLNITVGV